MKGLETGKDKVRKICEVLKKETLEPARQEVEEMRESARRQADEILADAKDTAERMVANAKAEIERHRQVFEASLAQASRQTIELLKEKIEQKLFSPALNHLIAKSTQDSKVLAQLITTLVQAIEKEGINTDLSVYIPAAVPAKEVNQALAVDIVGRLREKGVLLSPIGGGIQVKLIQDNITLDLSDAAIKELVAGYIRKDFRELIFGV
jgi:V/A-type H+-transporting ATPase subunit E